MKCIKSVFVLLIGVLLISCSSKNDRKINSEKGPEVSENVAEVQLKKIEVVIEGMTCEIGCAKLIESKTYKLNGMTASKVSFEHGMGQFTFDENKISAADIEKHINGIAGGELYRVSAIEEVESFNEFESNTELTD